MTNNKARPASGSWLAEVFVQKTAEGGEVGVFGAGVLEADS